jgi:hypothetical protein
MTQTLAVKTARSNLYTALVAGLGQPYTPTEGSALHSEGSLNSLDFYTYS